MVLEQAEITSIDDMLVKSQLRWASHLSRMEDHHLTKITLYGELSSGHRNIGALTKTAINTLLRAYGRNLVRAIYPLQEQSVAVEFEAFLIKSKAVVLSNEVKYTNNI